MDKLLELLGIVAKDPLAIVLGFLGIGAFIILYMIQAKRDNFDLRALISDDKRQPSIHKLGQLTALVMSTWMLVYLAVHDRMTPEYFITYMGIWTAAQTADRWIGKKYGISDRLDPTPGSGMQQPQDSGGGPRTNEPN